MSALAKVCLMKYCPHFIKPFIFSLCVKIFPIYTFGLNFSNVPWISGTFPSLKFGMGGVGGLCFLCVSKFLKEKKKKKKCGLSCIEILCSSQLMTKQQTTLILPSINSSYLCLKFHSCFCHKRYWWNFYTWQSLSLSLSLWLLEHWPMSYILVGLNPL